MYADWKKTLKKMRVNDIIVWCLDHWYAVMLTVIFLALLAVDMSVAFSPPPWTQQEIDDCIASGGIPIHWRPSENHAWTKICERSMAIELNNGWNLISFPLVAM